RMQGSWVHAYLGDEHSAYLRPVDDADTNRYDRAMAAHPLDRRPQRPAGRHDVLDEQDAVAAIQVALELVLRPMLLCGLADHDVGLAADQTDGRRDRDRAELDAREAIDVPRVRGHAFRDRPQQVRPGHGLLDIDVIRRGPAGSEGEGHELQRPGRLERGDEPRAVARTRAQ